MSKYYTHEKTDWHSLLLHLAIVVASVFVITLCMPRKAYTFYKYEKGKLWKNADLKASFDFPVYKSDDAIKMEKDSIMKRYEPYYKYDKEVEATMVRRFVSDFKNGIPGVPDDYKSIIANRLYSIYQQGVMNTTDYNQLGRDTTKMVRIVNGKNALSTSIKDVYSVRTAYEQLFLDKFLSEYKNELQHCSLNNYIMPNLSFDKERSNAFKKDLLNSIPLASGVVQQGQRIVGQGDIIGESTFRILESYKKEMEIRKSDERGIKTTMMGEALYVIIIMSFFSFYLFLFREDYTKNVRSLSMVYSLLVLFSIIGASMSRLTTFSPFVIPFSMVAIFVRVFMDSRTAFISYLTMILILACILRDQSDFTIIETMGGLAAIFSLRELTKRSQIFKTAIIVTFVMVITDISGELITNETIEEIDFSTANNLIASGVALLFTYPLLYIIEKIFGFTSEITLIELSNTNNELLRSMSEVTPGTFQHSIQVSNLAAAIANKIGADSQLVRTGALYHDIGKMVRPVYFTENQSGVNPHSELSQIDSAQIIISHVWEGIKMAEKYNLPTIIKDFIYTHHGIGKTKYFYVQYKNAHPDEDIDEQLFTYPGPNPFTREQAILMMADTVEAASRSLPDYTEQTIKAMVDKLIDVQVSEGYFMRCPITFRDITCSKDVLVEKLKTIYHTRVSYPKERNEA